MRRRILILSSALALLGVPSLAAEWPTKPISLVIPFAPGGGMDQVMLPLKPLLEERLGQSILLNYKAGAGGQIGWELLAATGEDGHTIAGMSLPHVVNTILFQEPRYRLDDFAPVGIMTEDVTFWFVPKDSPINSMSELLAEAKRRPGEVTIAIGSFTGENYLTVAVTEQNAGVQFRTVNLGGGGKVMGAVAGGHFDVGVSRPAAMAPARSELKGIGIFAPEASPLFPEAMPVDEQLPDLKVPHFKFSSGLLVARTFKENHPEAFARLAEAFKDAVNTPEFQERLAGMGRELTYQDPDAAQAYIEEVNGLMTKYRQLVEEASNRK